MKENTLHVLEFDRILESISMFSHSKATGKSIQNLRPLNKKGDIEKRFSAIREIRRLNQEGDKLGLTHFDDMAPFMGKLKPEGAILEPLELYSFVSVLRMISEISEQIRERVDLPYLRELAGSLTGFPGILSALGKSINSEGEILDSASPLLSQVRAQIRSLERNIRKKLEEKMSDRHVVTFLHDTFISQRAGRWVIPVRMDSKGLVPGVVHDISRTGETAFIEPLEIIGPANELENLIADAKTEEIRILKAISGMMRDILPELSVQYETVVYLDLLNSITGFADLLKMEIPQLSDSLCIKLIRARHPILELMRISGSIKQVVPLDFELGGENTVMVITGPNAGGKTIAIKTVGLLLTMALCGIPVPADSSSTFPFISRLLVDIGDEQSIEENLSTFSAHISKISHIIRTSSANTVVLLDELGTGTEPSQGSAIACSVLKHLREKGGLIFATTHLMDIVSFVYRAEGMVNASMDFDSETLNPLYRLRTGEPGQSHALEIAQKYGLSEDIISSAKELFGSMNIELYDLISDLKVKRNLYEQKLGELEDKKKDFEQKEGLLKERLNEIERKGREAEEKAYIEAESIIRNTKKQMHVLLEEARKKKREALKKTEKAHHEVSEKLKEFKKEPPISIDEIKEGDLVFVRSIGCDAPVTGINRKHMRLKISVRGMDIEIPLSDATVKKGITPLESLREERPEKTASSRLGLIGLRVNEALSRLEPFLNDAALADIGEVIIVHGVGTGALLKAVHEHLSGHPLVREFRSGELNEGGRGVTIVKLK